MQFFPQHHIFGKQEIKTKINIQKVENARGENHLNDARVYKNPPLNQSKSTNLSSSLKLKS